MFLLQQCYTLKVPKATSPLSIFVFIIPSFPPSFLPVLFYILIFDSFPSCYHFSLPFSPSSFLFPVVRSFFFNSVSLIIIILNFSTSLYLSFTTCILSPFLLLSSFILFLHNSSVHRTIHLSSIFFVLLCFFLSLFVSFFLSK